MTGEQQPRHPKISLFHELKPLGVRHSRRQIDRKEAKGEFPKRVPLGEKLVGWVTDEIIEHVDRQIASRSRAVGTLGSDKAPKQQPVHDTPMLGDPAATAAAKEDRAKDVRKKAAQPNAP